MVAQRKRNDQLISEYQSNKPSFGEFEQAEYQLRIDPAQSMRLNFMSEGVKIRKDLKIESDEINQKRKERQDLVQLYLENEPQFNDWQKD